MVRFVALALLVALAGDAAYAAVLPSATKAVPAAINHGPPVLTAAPSFSEAHDQLRARAATDYVCGRNGNYSVTCIAHTEICAGEVLPNGHAYAYCSTPGVYNQFIATTAYAYGDYLACPSNAYCCPSNAPSVWVNHFVASSSTNTYTVTGYECQNVSTTYSWNPAVNLLNPASFSASLYSLTHTTFSPTPSSSSSTSGSSTSSSGTATSTAQHHGMPIGEKIGLGVGIGAGIFGIALVSAAIWLLSPWLCRRKR